MNNFASQDFGSDSEDDDYCPTDDSISECDSDKEHDDSEQIINGKKKNNAQTSRKRKGGICLEVDNKEEDDNKEDVKKDENKEDYVVPDFKQEIRLQVEEKKEEAVKNRTDDLWSSFLKDTKTTPKKKPESTPIEAKKSASSNNTPKPSSTIVASKQTTDFFADVAPTSSSKVKKIEVEYDFAGESIKIMKDVPLNSKQALNNSHTAKRSAGLSGLLNKIGKKPKMGTLVKSKIDWNSFKEKEGLVEDMATHNKGKNGYIERKNFLERTDLRQFEKEKQARQVSRKR